jgi:hypothetical protein
MYFGMEGVRDFACVAAKVDKEASRRDPIHRESLLGEPLRDFPYVCGRWPEPLAELLRSEPVVEVSRARVVLLVDETVELLVARRTAPQHEEDVA